MPGQDLEKQANYTLKLLNMEPGIPQNRSHQQLMSAADGAADESPGGRTLRDVTFKQWVTVCILCFVNLINYMDRFTLAGEWFQWFFVLFFAVLSK